MNNLSNYATMTSNVGAENQDLKDRANEAKAQAQARIQAVVEPLQFAGEEHALDLLKSGVKNLSKKFGVPVDKVLDARDVYKKEGSKGLVRYFKNQSNQPLTSGDNIASMSKEDFKTNYEPLKAAMKTRFNQLNEDTKNQFRAEVRPQMELENDNPNAFDRFQNNLSKYEQGLNKYEAIEKETAPQSNIVSSITRNFGDPEIQGTLKGQSEVYKNIAKDTKIETNLIKKPSLKTELKEGAENLAKDEAEGSEEGPLGDIVGAGIGITSFLGGVLASEKLKLKPIQQISASYGVGQ